MSIILANFQLKTSFFFRGKSKFESRKMLHKLIYKITLKFARKWNLSSAKRLLSAQLDEAQRRWRKSNLKLHHSSVYGSVKAPRFVHEIQSWCTMRMRILTRFTRENIIVGLSPRQHITGPGRVEISCKIFVLGFGKVVRRTKDLLTRWNELGTQKALKVGSSASPAVWDVAKNTRSGGNEMSYVPCKLVLDSSGSGGFL